MLVSIQVNSVRLFLFLQTLYVIFYGYLLSSVSSEKGEGKGDSSLPWSPPDRPSIDFWQRVNSNQNSNEIHRDSTTKTDTTTPLHDNDPYLGYDFHKPPYRSRTADLPYRTIPRGLPYRYENMQIPIPTEHGLIKMTWEEAAFSYDAFFEFNRIWAKQRWMGVHCEQNPVDAWVLQEILFDKKPDLILETGTHNGGGALFYASLMSMYADADAFSEGRSYHGEVGSGAYMSGRSYITGKNKTRIGRVLTVDIGGLDELKHTEMEGVCMSEECLTPTRHRLWQERIDFIQGSSTDPETLNKISNYLQRFREDFKKSYTASTTAEDDPSEPPEPKIMVILDANHGFDHVDLELKSMWNFTSVGQYLVVQDTHLDQIRSSPMRPWLGPERAVREFFYLNTNSSRHFRVDQRREYMMFSQHRGGYMLRVS